MSFYDPRILQQVEALLEQSNVGRFQNLASAGWANGIVGTSQIVDGAVTAAKLEDGLRVVSITFIIDGAGAEITTGQKGHLEIPFDCTITGWTLLADQSGSIVIDVWKDVLLNFPPTVADTITGAEKPTLVAISFQQDLDLNTWTTAITAGDVLAFNVDSVTTVTRVTLSIRATRN